MNTTKMKIIVCDDDVIEKALRASKQAPSVKYMIVMPNNAFIDKKIVIEKYKDLIGVRMKIYNWEDIIKMVHKLSELGKKIVNVERMNRAIRIIHRYLLRQNRKIF